MWDERRVGMTRLDGFDIAREAGLNARANDFDKTRTLKDLVFTARREAEERVIKEVPERIEAHVTQQMERAIRDTLDMSSFGKNSDLLEAIRDYVNASVIPKIPKLLARFQLTKAQETAIKQRYKLELNAAIEEAVRAQAKEEAVAVVRDVMRGEYIAADDLPKRLQQLQADMECSTP